MSSSNRLVSGIVVAAIATASTGLVSPAVWAQRVLEGLPPPPTLPPADQYSAPATAPQPVTVPGPQSQPRETQPQREVRPPRETRSPRAAATQKVVVVRGDSPLLLSQVQQIAADATVREFRGQRLIQVGVFNTSAQARQQVAALRSQGIRAEVLDISPDQLVAAHTVATPPATVTLNAPTPTTPTPITPTTPAPVTTAANTPPVETGDLLPVTPVPHEVVFGEAPPVQPATTAQTFQESPGRAYYIVVPGDRDELPAIGNQIVRLGHGFAIAPLVEERQDPLGSHVRVGPFASRNAAERWNRYFRDFGINARVYYRR